MLYISQSEVVPVHLALLNFICLHDMLCGSLGMIKLDIGLVVLYFFENLLLLILKCIVHYLGLPLIIVFAYDMLWLAYFKQFITVLSPKKHFPLLVLFSVCLRTSNSLSMREFDKHLTCISF